MATRTRTQTGPKFELIPQGDPFGPKHGVWVRERTEHGDVHRGDLGTFRTPGTAARFLRWAYPGCRVRRES